MDNPVKKIQEQGKNTGGGVWGLKFLFSFLPPTKFIYAAIRWALVPTNCTYASKDGCDSCAENSLTAQHSDQAVIDSSWSLVMSGIRVGWARNHVTIVTANRSAHKIGKSVPPLAHRPTLTDGGAGRKGVNHL